MWVISGPFDSETRDELSPQKSKLLRPGKTYLLGRKGTDLVVANKSVSNKHLTFVVGPMTEEDAEHPDFRPSLHVINTGKKSRTALRGGKKYMVHEHGTHPLDDGDDIYILADVFLHIRWENVCCYAPPSQGYIPPISECAKLGINIVLTPNSSVTHHLTSTYSLTPAIASSLLSATQLVKPEWLTALLTFGIWTGDSPSPLEMEFSLPRLSEARPDYSPSLPSALHNLKVWEPNEARVHMFSDFRFIFIGERGLEVSLDNRDLVKRGDGEYECVAIEGGRKVLHSALAKGKSKGKKLVLVADEHAMGAAVGKDGWMEFVEEAKSFGLQFVRPEKLTQAVVHVNTSPIDCTYSISQDNSNRFLSPLPDVIPNTHIDEPSMPPPSLQSANQPDPQVESALRNGLNPALFAPRKRLTRRSASREPEPAVTTSPDASTGTTPGGLPSRFQSLGKPRRPLVPRPAAKPRAPASYLGLDDDLSTTMDEGPSVASGSNRQSNEPAPSSEPSATPKSAGPAPPTPNRKRTRGSTSAVSQRSSQHPTNSIIPGLDVEEPAFKRYKTLFDQSDPDRIAQSGMEEYQSMYKGIPQESLTQSESLNGVGGSSSGSLGGSRRGLDVVPEEEEESMGAGRSSRIQEETQRGKSQAGMKRGRAEDGDGDVEMVEAGVPEARKTKKRAVDGENAVEPTQDEPSSPPPEDQQRSKKPSSNKPASKVFASKSKSGGGAKPGKPDKDDAFLKAVASTKRGKKHEDQFDREFNNLRISKPDLKKDEAYKEWGVLEDFGYDGDVRGNFMVVVEMEVKDKSDRNPLRRGLEGRADWVGKPDFKKFKKKVPGERVKPVELIPVQPEDEFGFPATQTLKATTQEFAHTLTQEGSSEPRTTQRRPTTQAIVVEDPDDSDATVPRFGRRKPSIQPKSKPPSNTRGESQVDATAKNKGRQTRTTAAKKGQLLFDPSDDEDGSAGGSRVAGSDEDEDEDVGSTLRTNGRRTQQEMTKRRAAAKKVPVVLDDSDDGLAFKGFGRRKKR